MEGTRQVSPILHCIAPEEGDELADLWVGPYIFFDDALLVQHFRRILETLVHKFGGRAVGINSLAVAVGEVAGDLSVPGLD